MIKITQLDNNKGQQHANMRLSKKLCEWNHNSGEQHKQITTQINVKKSNRLG